MRLLLLALLLTSTSFAQTAKVIQLSPKDAEEAQSLRDQQAILDAKMKMFEEKINHDYLEDKAREHFTFCMSGTNGVEHCSNPKGEKRYERLRGWESGFEFSDDYKFIVPKQASDTQSFKPCAGGTHPYPCMDTNGIIYR